MTSRRRTPETISAAVAKAIEDTAELAEGRSGETVARRVVEDDPDILGSWGEDLAWAALVQTCGRALAGGKRSLQLDLFGVSRELPLDIVVPAPDGVPGVVWKRLLKSSLAELEFNLSMRADQIAADRSSWRHDLAFANDLKAHGIEEGEEIGAFLRRSGGHAEAARASEAPPVPLSV